MRLLRTVLDALPILGCLAYWLWPLHARAGTVRLVGDRADVEYGLVWIIVLLIIAAVAIANGLSRRPNGWTR